MKAVCRIELFNNDGSPSASIEITRHNKGDDATDSLAPAVRSAIAGLLEGDGNLAPWDILSELCGIDYRGPFGLMSQAFDAWMKDESDSGGFEDFVKVKCPQPATSAEATK